MVDFLLTRNNHIDYVNDDTLMYTHYRMRIFDYYAVMRIKSGYSYRRNLLPSDRGTRYEEDTVQMRPGSSGPCTSG